MLRVQTHHPVYIYIYVRSKDQIRSLSEKKCPERVLAIFLGKKAQNALWAISIHSLNAHNALWAHQHTNNIGTTYEQHFKNTLTTHQHNNNTIKTHKQNTNIPTTHNTPTYQQHTKTYEQNTNIPTTHKQHTNNTSTTH